MRATDAGAHPTRLTLRTGAAGLMAATMLLTFGCGTDDQAHSRIAVAGVDVNAIETAPSAGDPDGVVLFLHGASYTSDVWVRTGAIERVNAAGFAAVAVDLPGYGDTDGPIPDDKKGQFLTDLVDAVRIDDKPVTIVSPSMSGEFTFAMLNAENAPDAIMFVAPVRGNTYQRIDEVADTRVLAVVGENDAAFAGDQNERLAEQFDDGQTLTIKNAGHAAYEDQPSVFNDALEEFIQANG